MYGQMTIFDFLKAKEQKHSCGDWVESHGARVKFEDIQVNKFYISDKSTVSHKWFKLIYVVWKKDDAIGYVDDERGIKRGWSWGNSWSALTRKLYIDSEADTELKEAATSGWLYEVE